MISGLQVLSERDVILQFIYITCDSIIYRYTNQERALHEQQYAAGDLSPVFLKEMVLLSEEQ
jgi:hypothetical protein